MQITQVELLQLEIPQESGEPKRNQFLQVDTDEGVSGRAVSVNTPEEVARMRGLVVGADPLERERLFQELNGTRHVRKGWEGPIDNCLWDIAGKIAGMPVCDLIGRARDRFPAYLTQGRFELEGYLQQIDRGRELSGIEAYKFHSYRTGKEDLPIMTAVREAVGPDYALMHDPVCHYSLRDAIHMGHVLDELDFLWLEEPMHEQRMDHYQRLCGEVAIPILATETLMSDMWLCAQWLIQGATDLLRGNARNGTTQVLKMARFAELHTTNIELNYIAGLYGLIHTHLGCSIPNPTYFESFAPESDALRRQGEEWGLLNAPLIEDGHLTPPLGSGWGAQWDEARFDSLIVERR
jgi:L-alanine-DL-glutamate epimerase-like enolase superfamily enzyme